MVKITSLVRPEWITFLDVDNRDAVLHTLVDHLAKQNAIAKPAEFLRAILDRERIVSTGIGMGVAIPHAKMDDIDTFFMGVAILKHGVDWHALDGSPVRLVFMIGGPDDKQTEYLQILSALTSFIKEEERRRKLIAATDPKQVAAEFKALG